MPWPRAAEPERQYLDSVAHDTRAAIKAGIGIADAYRHVAKSERGHWLLFDDYHPRNVTRAIRTRMGVTPSMFLSDFLVSVVPLADRRSRTRRTERGGAGGAMVGSAACIFGDRVVEDAGDLVAIDAPARAEDAAIVPVAIRVAEKLAPEVRGLYLVIDDNPSPLAAHFVLGPLVDTREIATRVRIDDYTYLHAVAETADGRLYAAARFIKAAGGCSAPAGKDQALALERLGKMKLTLAERTRARGADKGQIVGQSPEQLGFADGPGDPQLYPGRFHADARSHLQRSMCSSARIGHRNQRGPEPQFIFQSGRAGGSAGVIEAKMLDSSQRHFSQSSPVPAAPQM